MRSISILMWWDIMHISHFLPSAFVLTSDGKALIDAYDQIVNSEMELMGLYKYNKLFKNRMYLHVMYTSYMYATSYHTAYNDGTLAELCNVDKLKTSSCWGLHMK